MKKYLIAACLALVAVPAYADTFLYACKVKMDTGNTHLYAAVLDLDKHTITWRGKTYRNIKSIPYKKDDGIECAKECFAGSGIMLSTATQGYASLSMLAGTGPGDDGLMEWECDLVNK